MKKTPFVKALHYRCTECGQHYSIDELHYLCDICGQAYKPGQPLKGVLEAVLDYDAIAEAWAATGSDIRLFSPVNAAYYPDLPVGWTPFFKSEKLCAAMGLSHLWIKNDGLNPSGSLKDRASQLVVAHARQLGIRQIAAASTGNAASALSALCASAGLEAIVFVPQSAPQAKLTQMHQYGAYLIPVDGSYDLAFSLSLEFSGIHQILNRNTAYHPFTIEGKKTAALEIFMQNKGCVPDAVVIPVGDGVILAGIYKGFKDLMLAGLTDKMPRLIGVQAERSAAIHRYVQSGDYHNFPDPDTVADSISVSVPSNAYWARQAVVNSNGFTVAVSDEAILEAQQQLASLTGVFAEPAAAATLSGLKKGLAQKDLDRSEQVVLLITGHGLKDVGAAMTGFEMAPPIKSLDDIEKGVHC